MTNGDWLQSMTMDDLSDFLYKITYCCLEPCNQHELLDKADFTELDAFMNEMSDQMEVTLW